MIKNKNAVITGSTSGIGKALAAMLAGQGVNVMLNGFGDAQEIEAQRLGLETEHGVTALYSNADMTQPDAIRAMISRAQNDLGSIDILINNAGIQHVSPVEDFPTAKWDAIIAINMSSAFHTIAASLPGMKAAGWGRIINIASVHSLVASPYKAAYVTAKHGVAGLTKTIALECADKGVTVNAVSPGYVWTPLVEAQIPDTAAARGITEDEVIRDVLLAAQPTKQFVTVEQISAAVSFLCSEAASAMTGSNLTIDGGWTAQ